MYINSEAIHTYMRVSINSLFCLPFVPYCQFSQLNNLVGTFMSFATRLKQENVKIMLKGDI